MYVRSFMQQVLAAIGLTALPLGGMAAAAPFTTTGGIAPLDPTASVVFDTSNGTPQIVYRQDLTQLGWALGKEARQKWLLGKGTG